MSTNEPGTAHTSAGTDEAPWSPPPLDFDPQEVRDRNRHEREIRMRTAGGPQYEAAQGRFAADPFSPPPDREPVERRTEVLIVGAGFGGLLMAAQLHRQGVHDVLMVDKAGDFGGTWYWNRYPGAACDIESYIYLPMLDEVGEVPSRKFTGQPDLLAHAQTIGRTFDLYDKALFQTQVTELRWSQDDGRWQASTDQGDVLSARYVCIAGGAIHQPKLPTLPGVETFEGHAFHTARWDYAVTGGSYDEPMDRLAGLRVGVVGTAATAVQCVPPLGEAARELVVFQRTPSVVDARDNQDTDPQWVASLEPGWLAERMENFEAIVSGDAVDHDLVRDGRTAVFRTFRDAQDAGGAPARELAELTHMERIRRRIDTIVHDRATADSLKPYYAYQCKRPAFQDGYLETFNRPNVTLVDTRGQGIERVTPGGVVAGGVEHPLDVLIFATGFEMQTEFSDRVGFEILGRDGLSLREYWSEGTRSLFGIHAHGFPNLFVMSGPQAPAAFNFTYVLTRQAQHLSRLVRRLVDEGSPEVDATPEAEDAWLQEVLEFADQKQEFAAKCVPGYIGGEGMSLRAVRDGFYGRTPVGSARRYFDRLTAWEAEGERRGLGVRSRTTTVDV